MIFLNSSCGKSRDGVIIKSFVLLAVILLANSWHVLQAQQLFTRVYGGASYDFGSEVIQTPDNGFLVAGTTGSFGLGSGQVMLIKTDDNGHEEWRKFYGGEFADRSESMQLAADGNLLIAGVTEVANNDYQMYAIKVTTNGDTIWTRNYGTESWDFCNQAVALADGGFALIGQTYASGNGDFLLVRIDSDGDTLWTRTYGGPELESGESIAEASDGGFYLAGNTQSFGAGETDMYVVRTNSDGDTLWTKTFGGPQDDFCNAVAVTADNGYVVVGGSYNLTPNKSDFIVIKDLGTAQWQSQENSPGDCFLTDVIIEPGSGNVTVVGYYTIGSFGKEDARIIRYGGLDGIWNALARTHGSQQDDRFVDLKLCSDGGYVMVGHTQGFLDRFDDVYLVKADDFGVSVDAELGIDRIDLGEEQFGLSLGPNPIMMGQSTLYIQNYGGLSKLVNEELRIRFFDGIGRVVKEQSIDAGESYLSFENLAKGIYNYQLVAGSTTVLATGKAVKIN